jgi:hypothetical protein
MPLSRKPSAIIRMPATSATEPFNHSTARTSRARRDDEDDAEQGRQHAVQREQPFVAQLATQVERGDDLEDAADDGHTAIT